MLLIAKNSLQKAFYVKYASTMPWKFLKLLKKHFFIQKLFFVHFKQGHDNLKINMRKV